MGGSEKELVKPLSLRFLAVAVLAILIVAKFFAFGPIKQISLAEINIQTAQLLAKASLRPPEQKKQSHRADLQQFQFYLADCVAPYFALQALTLEDPMSVLEAAQPLPQNLEPHVIYLGEELGIDDRLGLKLTAVKKFISYRLGLSPERPSAYLYVILASPKCAGYRQIDWSKVWASSSGKGVDTGAVAF